MSSRIASTEEIELHDWNSPITIYPLTIAKLRKLMKLYEELTADEETTLLDLQVKMVAKAMEVYEPKLSDPETLEEHIDQVTLDRILYISSGIKFNDPNLQAAMAANGITD